MIQMQQPIYKGVAQYFEYVFHDGNDQVIVLSDSDTATLYLKVAGQTGISVPAAILAPSEGKVNCPSWTPPMDGVWQGQFGVVQASGAELMGEIFEFTVVKNVRDLSLTEIAKY